MERRVIVIRGGEGVKVVCRSLGKLRRKKLVDIGWRSQRRRGIVTVRVKAS